MTDNNRTISATESSRLKKRSLIVDLLRRLVKEKPLGMVGGVIVLILLVTGIFADLLAPYGMNEIHLVDRLSEPSAQYILGTDHLGRDLLSNIIYGARVSVIIGLSCAAISTIAGTVIGSFSGLIGGKFDMVAQRFVDAWMSIPQLLILLIIMSLVGQGVIQIILVLGISGGITGSRVMRSAVIGIKENTYVDAGRVIGCSTPRLILRHITPNIMGAILIDFTLRVGGVIMMEASLSFLGFGVPPGVPSWGSMLSAEGRQYMEISPALALWPGLALSSVVYGINMLGDAFRDLLDPRLRGGIGRYSGSKLEKVKKLMEKGNQKDKSTTS
ncbi:ABC transporter permease [Chloroflexota bacterium]